MKVIHFQPQKKYCQEVRNVPLTFDTSAFFVPTSRTAVYFCSSGKWMLFWKRWILQKLRLLPTLIAFVRTYGLKGLYRSLQAVTTRMRPSRKQCRSWLPSVCIAIFYAVFSALNFIAISCFNSCRLCNHQQNQCGEHFQDLSECRRKQEAGLCEWFYACCKISVFLFFFTAL